MSSGEASSTAQQRMQSSLPSDGCTARVLPGSFGIAGTGSHWLEGGGWPLPRTRGECQPARTINDDPQRGIVVSLHGMRSNPAERYRLPMLSDADDVIRPPALRNVDKKAVPGFLRKKAKADDLSVDCCDWLPASVAWLTESLC